MRNHLIVLIIVIFISSSCSQKKEPCLSISVENRIKWISDSTGCLNERFKLINTDIAYKNFINSDLSCIKKQLGNFDFHYKSGNVDYYCYFLRCKYAPIPKNNHFESNKSSHVLKKDVTLLRFGVKKNKVLSASIIVP